MSHEELVHEETREGFSIRLYFGAEDYAPDWDFESEEDKQELFRKIDAGLLLWFYAHVTVSRTPSGEVEGDDFIGGCCYESVQDFVKNSGYYDDMVSESIERARDAARKSALREVLVGRGG